MKKSIHKFYTNKIKASSELSFDECAPDKFITLKSGSHGFQIFAYAASLVLVILIFSFLDRETNQVQTNFLALAAENNGNEESDVHASELLTPEFQEKYIELVRLWNEEDFSAVTQIFDEFLQSYDDGELNNYDEFIMWGLNGQFQSMQGNFTQAINYFETALNVDNIPAEMRDAIQDQAEAARLAMENQ